jgi:hypothetical protein
MGGVSSTSPARSIATTTMGGFTFDAFGLDANEIDNEVNAALEELAQSNPDLSLFMPMDQSPTNIKSTIEYENPNHTYQNETNNIKAHSQEQYSVSTSGKRSTDSTAPISSSSWGSSPQSSSQPMKHELITIHGGNKSHSESSELTTSSRGASPKIPQDKKNIFKDPQNGSSFHQAKRIVRPEDFVKGDGFQQVVLPDIDMDDESDHANDSTWGETNELHISDMVQSTHQSNRKYIVKDADSTNTSKDDSQDSEPIYFQPRSHSNIEALSASQKRAQEWAAQRTEPIILNPLLVARPTNKVKVSTSQKRATEWAQESPPTFAPGKVGKTIQPTSQQRELSDDEMNVERVSPKPFPGKRGLQSFPSDENPSNHAQQFRPIIVFRNPSGNRRRRQPSPERMCENEYDDDNIDENDCPPPPPPLNDEELSNMPLALRKSLQNPYAERPRLLPPVPEKVSLRKVDSPVTTSDYDRFKSSAPSVTLRKVSPTSARNSIESEKPSFLSEVKLKKIDVKSPHLMERKDQQYEDADFDDNQEYQLECDEIYEDDVNVHEQKLTYKERQGLLAQQERVNRVEQKPNVNVKEKRLTYRERQELLAQQEQANRVENHSHMDVHEKKLTYREQQEIIAQQERASRANIDNNLETQQENDVAAQIRRRIVENRKNLQKIDINDSRVGSENLSELRKGLRKVNLEDSQLGEAEIDESDYYNEEDIYDNSDSVAIEEDQRDTGSKFYDAQNEKEPPQQDVTASRDTIHKYHSENDAKIYNAVSGNNKNTIVEPKSQVHSVDSATKTSPPTQSRKHIQDQPLSIDTAQDLDDDVRPQPIISPEMLGKLRSTNYSSPKSNDTNEVQTENMNIDKKDKTYPDANEEYEEEENIILPSAKKENANLLALFAARSSMMKDDVTKDSENAAATKLKAQVKPIQEIYTSSPSHDGPALKDDPAYSKYFKMLKMGLPIEAVKHAMTRDGLDPEIMDGDHSKPASQKSTNVALKDDPRYAKYFKMLKMGLPLGAVKNAMERDGEDPAVLDSDHDLPHQSPKNKPSEPLPKDKFRRTRVHWDTLGKVLSNSLWALVSQDPDVEKIEEHLDENEFAELFQAEVGASGILVNKDNEASKKKNAVKVIDPKRANNGGIILARLKLTYEEMATAIDSLDDSLMTAEQMQGILEYIPTKEEKHALRTYMTTSGKDSADAFDELCECEKFMVAMMTVPHSKEKVRALLFKLQFHQCITDLEKEARMVDDACDQLRNSVRLRKLLGVVLNLGNRLNTAGPTRKGKAGAFTIESLLKLNQAKAFDKKTTFLHYVILVIRRQNESVTRFKEDIPDVLKADKVYWDTCISDLEQVESQLENIRKIALHQYFGKTRPSWSKRRKKHSEEDDGSDESITLEEEVKALRSTRVGNFTLSAIKTVSSLRENVESTNSKFISLLEYFGMDEKKKMQPHELFTIFSTFTKHFDSAREEVTRQQKAKKKEESKKMIEDAQPAIVKALPASTKTKSDSVGTKNASVTPQKPLKVSSMQPNMSSIIKSSNQSTIVRSEHNSIYYNKAPNHIKNTDEGHEELNRNNKNSNYLDNEYPIQNDHEEDYHSMDNNNSNYVDNGYSIQNDHEEDHHSMDNNYSNFVHNGYSMQNDHEEDHSSMLLNQPQSDNEVRTVYHENDVEEEKESYWENHEIDDVQSHHDDPVQDYESSHGCSVSSIDYNENNPSEEPHVSSPYDEKRRLSSTESAIEENWIQRESANATAGMSSEQIMRSKARLMRQQRIKSLRRNTSNLEMSIESTTKPSSRLENANHSHSRISPRLHDHKTLSSTTSSRRHSDENNSNNRRSPRIHDHKTLSSTTSHYYADENNSSNRFSPTVNDHKTHANTTSTRQKQPPSPERQRPTTDESSTTSKSTKSSSRPLTRRERMARRNLVR